MRVTNTRFALKIEAALSACDMTAAPKHQSINTEDIEAFLQDLQVSHVLTLILRENFSRWNLLFSCFRMAYICRHLLRLGASCIELGFLNDNFRGALFVFHLMGDRFTYLVRRVYRGDLPGDTWRIIPGLLSG